MAVPYRWGTDGLSLAVSAETKGQDTAYALLSSLLASPFRRRSELRRSLRKEAPHCLKLKKAGGADAVKIEGGREITDTVAAITEGGIPVFGHIGVTPQTSASLDLRAATAMEAAELVTDAQALDEADVSGMVLELVASEAAAAVTDGVDGLTIGIGAGPHCDAQVVTLHDLLGLQDVLPETAADIRTDFGKEIIDHFNTFHERVAEAEFLGDTQGHKYVKRLGGLMLSSAASAASRRSSRVSNRRLPSA